MGDVVSWRAKRLTFVDPNDLKNLIKAEIGLTDRFLSFIACTPSGVCRRAEVAVLSETGTQHRLVRGKLIRGLDEATAKKLIAKVNQSLAGSGTILKEVRHEVVDGKTLAVYKRRDPHAVMSLDDQTPTLLVRDQRAEVTVVNVRYADIVMSRRRTDTPIE